MSVQAHTGTDIINENNSSLIKAFQETATDNLNIFTHKKIIIASELSNLRLFI